MSNRVYTAVPLSRAAALDQLWIDKYVVRLVRASSRLHPCPGLEGAIKGLRQEWLASLIHGAPVASVRVKLVRPGLSGHGYVPLRRLKLRRVTTSGSQLMETVTLRTRARRV